MNNSGIGKFGIGIIALTVLLLVGGAYFFTRPEKDIDIPARDEAAYEYFWGNGCPHCADVQSFFDGWDKYNQTNIIKREVWYNKDNSKIMEARFNACNPKPNNSSQMSVPFLVTPDGQCLVGSTPIIDLFKSL